MFGLNVHFWNMNHDKYVIRTVFHQHQVVYYQHKSHRCVYAIFPRIHSAVFQLSNNLNKLAKNLYQYQGKYTVNCNRIIIIYNTNCKMMPKPFSNFLDKSYHIFSHIMHMLYRFLPTMHPQLVILVGALLQVADFKYLSS